MDRVSEFAARGNVYAPPINDMGVVSTTVKWSDSLESEHVDVLSLKIDWLGVTFIGLLGVEEVIGFLGMDINDFEFVDRYLMHYTKRLERGDIRILYDGAEDGMGIHVLMSGDGVRQFESYHKGEVDWPQLIGTWLECGAKFRRIDLSVDDRPLVRPLFFDIEDIEEHVRSRDYISPMSYNDIRDSSGKWRRHKTVYLGHPESDLRIRFYDKGAEQKTYEAWNRVEFQLRNERAEFVSHYLAGGVSMGEVCFGLLKKYFRPVLRPLGKDSNKSRWKVPSWWLSFVGEVEPLKVSVSAVPLVTVERVHDWLERQVSKRLSMLLSYYDGDASFVQNLMAVGNGKWSRQDAQIVAGWRHIREDSMAVDSCVI